MIYIFVNLDSKNKKQKIESFVKTHELFFLTTKTNKEELKTYANSVSMFGQKQVYVLDNFLNKDEEIVPKDFLESLHTSESIFVFFEDSLNAPLEKNFKKYANIERSIKENKKTPEINIFDITNLFARKDKIGTWVFYQKLLDKNVAPEEISGVLFWKIKTMIISGGGSFNKDTLKKHIVTLTDIYHKAHRGELDFALSLENFLLTSLSR